MEKVNVKAHGCFSYEFIPPRCRKPRTQIVEFDMMTGIRKPTFDEAPVAFRYPTYSFEREKVADPSYEYVEYRLFDGKLYKREEMYCGVGIYKRSGVTTVGETGWSWADMSHIEFYIRSTDEKLGKRAAENTIRKNAKRFILLGDNEVWRVCGEPMYCIYTFGLGHNHADTCLSIDDRYNTNIDSSRYFSALDADAAVEAAVGIALRRGDTNSVEHIRNTRKIEVLIPEAVTCNPVKDHNGGNPILKMFEGVIDSSPSASDAGLGVVALAMVTI